jgi:rod shape-determining protein MreC
MPVHQHHTSWRSLTVLSWRSAVYRYSFVLFLLFASGLLILSRVNPVFVNDTRGHFVEGVAPILSIAAKPIDLVTQFTRRVSTYMELQTENEKLRTENAQLKQWQNAVAALGHENKELRSLLRFKAEPGLAFVSARVIAETGGPFVRSLVVTAGKDDGVREGMAAMTGEGLVGRVVEVSDRSSRVLMLTDLNSRLPVIVTGTGDRAIAAGDNSAELKLLYLPQDAVLVNGSRVLTSGHGGIFPPNLPVGTVQADKNGTTYSVKPFAAMGRISYITLIDFNLAGGPTNAIANRLNAEKTR